MDIFEAIKVFHTPRPIPQGPYTSPEEKHYYEAEWQLRQEAEGVCRRYQTYLPFTAREGHDVALAALDLFDRGVDQQFQYIPHHILENLARAVPGALQGLYPRLIERDLFWGDGVLYREVDPETRDLLLSLLESTHHELRYHDLLCALAWIGDEKVQELFTTLKHTPPAWTSVASVREYGRFAGWELAEDGKRRALCLEPCYSLTFVEATPSPTRDWPVAVMAPHEGNCPWCGRPFITLFDLHLRDSRLNFLPVQGERLRIPICVNCSFQSAVFFDIESDGATHWSESNGDPPPRLKRYGDHLLPRWPQQQFVFGERRRTAYIDSGSHLGGRPDWVQYPDYPHCPTCQQSMLFVGQLDPSTDIGAPPVVSGVASAFLCALCKKVTAEYQQT